MRAGDRIAAGALLLLAQSLVVPAAAKTFTVEGVTFSDELGGFTLLGVTGRGLLDDPFVVIEEVTGPGEIVLVIRGLAPRFGNRIGSQHMVGFAMTKVAINRTGRPWYEYELELREVLDSHSPYGDGLSFGQATMIGRPFLSSAFSRNAEVDEPYDSVSFWDGAVEAGEKASFSIVVSDTSPVSEFYLFQQPLRAVAQLGEER
ncbi:hypothetical protein [Rhodospirillaceae bacterium SYSU D60014]|uniref:hypothetical protein n=1 Tax=Virgifigura deserti TaxID=2268457 RepID=UPI000E66D6B2